MATLCVDGVSRALLVSTSQPAFHLSVTTYSHRDHQPASMEPTVLIKFLENLTCQLEQTGRDKDAQIQTLKKELHDTKADLSASNEQTTAAGDGLSSNIAADASHSRL